MGKILTGQTVIVVLGHGNNKYLLSDDSRSRCDEVLKLYRKYKKYINRIICSGGLFDASQNGITVSAAMKEYLVNFGIPSSLVDEEPDSLTTIDNAERTARLLQPEDKIHVITSDYHLERAEMIWKELLGIKVTMHSAQTLIVEAKEHAKKLRTELYGIWVVRAYRYGFKCPEKFMRSRRIAATMKWRDKKGKRI